MKILANIILVIWLIAFETHAQSLKGRVFDANTHLPLEGVQLILSPGMQTIFTDEQGTFHFNNSAQQQILIINAIGFAKQVIPSKEWVQPMNIQMQAHKTELSEITIVSKTGQELRTVSLLDQRIKGINNSQEILRMVPGLFIGQHQGGGKAEQIFIRGFDCDHGTDILIAADGIPVNLVSQAHGQGYADMHFVIPETVQQVDFQKGPYQASKGNFATSGFVELKTKNALSNNLIKIEGGMFDTYRAMGMFNLLGKEARKKEQFLYVAAEYAYSNGYFDHPQQFNRRSVFLKYHGRLSSNQYLTASASSFSSQWMASGQIPERALSNGQIGFYGAIDPSEGGYTKRENIQLQLSSKLAGNALLKNQLYYSHVGFKLHSNFTFYLEDSVNGDQIRQGENRQLMGYQSSVEWNHSLGSIPAKTEVGLGIRYDEIQDIELSHTIQRNTVLQQISFGNISEVNASAYWSESLKLSQKTNLMAGIRYDQFYNAYTDHLMQDTLLKASAGIVSPKISLTINKNSATQYYLNLGKGFHSNDTRVCVRNQGLNILPAAYSADIGLVSKPFKKLLVQTALWHLWLDQEFVYSGDAGYAEPSGKTYRVGIDVSLRYQANAYLFADIDMNYSHGRYAEAREGENYIPLAPVISSSGGLNLKNYHGWNAGLRYRYLGNRPANENNSILAKGYFLNDLLLSYTHLKYEFGLSISNLWNVQWKETQFETTSRLRGEQAAVSEIHFTPGTKFAAKIFVNITF